MSGSALASKWESSAEALLRLAGDFSPRYEMVRPYLVVVDIAGLGRLLGTPREIGEAFCRLARERGLIVSVGIASTQTAALLLALHQATTASVTPTSVPPVASASVFVPAASTAPTARDTPTASVVPPALTARAVSAVPPAPAASDVPAEPGVPATSVVPPALAAHAISAVAAAPDAFDAPTRSVEPAKLANANTSASRVWTGAEDDSGQAPAHSNITAAAYSHADRLIVVRPGREPAALASLPLSLLSALPNDRLTNDDVAFLRRRPDLSSSAAAAVTGPATEFTPASLLASSHDTPSSSKTAPARGKTRGKSGRGSARNYRLAPSPGQLAERGDEAVLDVLRRWGLKTLGELAALQADALFERLGREGLELQEVARGRDARPLVPTMAGEPFEASLALEWPIEELEPLSFVLTRLLEPLCARLERCDRGAAVLHVNLRLVSRECHTRRLELPAPMRDPKVLRTLVLLDLESHPPNAGIDRVTLTIDPTPGRIVQHSLLARPLPSPEQLSTLTARLTAVMGDNRVGAPVLVDTHRPEAFALRRFQVNDLHPRRHAHGHTHAHTHAHAHTDARAHTDAHAHAQTAAHARNTTVTLDELRRIYLLAGKLADPPTRTANNDAPAFVLRRFRRPIPARVRVEHDRPVHVAPQGLPGGPVVQAAGPWRTSGEWWKNRPRIHPSNAPGASAELSHPVPQRRRATRSWNRDEWDVVLTDGCLYRIHLDHAQNRWFVEASLD